MIKVYVKKQSNYPVSAVRVKKVLSSFLKTKGIVSDAQVSVAVVGIDKIKLLSKKYLNDNDLLHSVLTFPANDIKGDFIYPPSGIIFLGEIVICFPLAQDEAEKEGKRVDQKIQELLEHGALHLIGIHHE